MVLSQIVFGTHGFFSLFLDTDGPGYAFFGGLPDKTLKVFWNFIDKDACRHLIFIVSKHFRTQLIAIPIAHTQIIINFYLHDDLL
jgi:hypothetical protein